MADGHPAPMGMAPAQFSSTEGELDQSEEFSYADSGFGASIAKTDTTYNLTARTDFHPFVYEHGRRYQAYREGVYMLPNDLQEIERLDHYHRSFVDLLDGKLYIAPLGKDGHQMRKVLDIGTGTGTWANEMAEEFPDAEVIGNDLSNIQQAHAPNCRFEVDDVESDWVYPKDHFDFIHARSLSGSFKDWDAVLQRCYEHTAPGGFFEFQDYDCNIKILEGPVPRGAIWRLSQVVLAAAVSTSRPFEVAETIKSRIAAAGFVDVVQRTEMWPMGPWPKDERMKRIGLWTLIGMQAAFHTFSLALLTRVMGWSQEEVRRLCDEAVQELNEGKNKLYATAYYVCGRKPK